MKDYKLSELKQICVEHCIKGKERCASINCPIKDECFQIAIMYFSDLELDTEKENNND